MENGLDPADSSTSNPFIPFINKLAGNVGVPRPRKKTPMNVWRVSHRAEIENKLKEQIVAQSIPRRMVASHREKIAKEMFAQLPKEVQDQWEAQAAQEHAIEMEKWNDLVKGEVQISTSLEDRQKYIQGVGQFMQPILDLICKSTGWKATLIAGGPDPAHGGRLNMVSLDSEATASGDIETNSESASEKRRYEEVLIPIFEEYLKKCFSPESKCQSQALATKEGFAPLDEAGIEEAGATTEVLGLTNPEVSITGEASRPVDAPPRTSSPQPSGPSGTLEADVSSNVALQAPSRPASPPASVLPSRPPSPPAPLRSRSPSIPCPSPRSGETTEVLDLTNLEVPILRQDARPVEPPPRTSSPQPEGPSDTLEAGVSSSVTLQAPPRPASPPASVLPTRPLSPPPPSQPLSPPVAPLRSRSPSLSCPIPRSPPPSLPPSCPHCQAPFPLSSLPFYPAPFLPQSPVAPSQAAMPAIPASAAGIEPNLETDESLPSISVMREDFNSVENPPLRAVISAPSRKRERAEDKIPLSAQTMDLRPEKRPRRSVRLSGLGQSASPSPSTSSIAPHGGTSTVEGGRVATSSWKVPSDAAPWFKKAMDMLRREEDLGPRWSSLLEVWTEFERRNGYREAGKLGSTHRPKCIADWIQRARKPQWRPPFESISKTKYMQQILDWWTVLQPDWRLAEDGTIDFGRVDGDWEVLRLPGLNGLFSFVAGLFYGGLGAKRNEEARVLWSIVVEDFILVCSRLSK
ncbi:hypothetical protein D9613_007375 [Agrocybe pediades]|uniref:Uncharacterized protein n=1 Tax=Agrocybe pediades TaxID=84607 RepID=A0A8H4VMQ1_9AGAR|nr:hypothetical protein D9613_007375 [Agrocybe pediades]